MQFYLIRGVLTRFQGISRIQKQFSVSISEGCIANNGRKIDFDKEEQNIILRKHKNNVPIIRKLLEELTTNPLDVNLKNRLSSEINKLPNATHPRLLSYKNEPREIGRFNCHVNGKPINVQEFSEIGKRLNLYRMEHLGNFTGHKSYYLMGPFASLELALIQYTLKTLKSNDFKLISVPDILDSSIIEGCGMQTDGDRTQVYKLNSKLCLSGTSEMALAGLFTNKIFNACNLPIKIAAVSRCYRAETSGLQEEKGIYRVHQFTKVEMFAICKPNQSELMLQTFKDIEIMIFNDLKLQFRLLDMPPSELGAPAYEKYDIEAWMPGRKMWGEISSCSNCTDYQAKRLNIRYRNANNKLEYVNTINGTAAAIPRLLIALVESNQVGGDVLFVPDVLRDFFGENKIKKDKRIPELKLIKHMKNCK